jgi:hypothetical protein
VITLAGWLNATRIIGLSAYLLALVSCAIAWAYGHGAAHKRRLAAVIGALEAALLLDMALDGRWWLHDLLENELIARRLYPLREGPQVVALGILGIGAVAGIGWALWSFRGRAGASLAACGAVLSLACWGVEVISLHGVDLVFYREIYGVKLVAGVWIACALMTGMGILWDTRAIKGASKVEDGVEGPPTSLTNF